MTSDQHRMDRMTATRASYDAVAGAYAEAMSDELRRKPLDRALLTAFAESPPLTVGRCACDQSGQRAAPPSRPAHNAA
jgi:hypothetical protein